MKIRRINIVSISILILCFIFCVVYGFFFAKIPEILPYVVKNYRWLISIESFIFALPAFLFTSAVTGWSIDFGIHQGGSRLRFSPAMMGRLKSVLINSVIFVLILTVCAEIFTPLIETKLQNYKNQPSQIIEYQKTAEDLFSFQNYELSYRYARLANSLDPTNEENKRLLFQAESALNEKAKISKSFVQTMNELTFGDFNFGLEKEKIKIPTEPFKSYKLMQLARQCLLAQDWFGAHYYAQQAIRSADSKDINMTECKQIAAEAWNKISQTRVAGTTQKQKIFEKKYEGYISLINGDFLHAYYIFKTLSMESKNLSVDPDVVRYLKISEQMLNNQYFYFDETFNLKGYETSNNVHFKIENQLDGTTSVIFIKGVTSIGRAANMIQYLRGFTLVTLSPENEYISGIYVPYAKMKNVETRYLDKDFIEKMGLDEKTKTIPYILLNSIDRNLEGVRYTATDIGGKKDESDKAYLFLPIPYEHFDYIKEAAKGPDTMILTSLFKFYDLAKKYGYSSEIYGQALMNRIFMPLFFLVLFVLTAIVSWHCRLNENEIFKFHWIYIFPALCPVFVSLLQIIMSFFKFLNFSILGTFGNEYALVAGLMTYSFFLLIVCVGFLAGHNSGNK